MAMNTESPPHPHLLEAQLSPGPPCPAHAGGEPLPAQSGSATRTKPWVRRQLLAQRSLRYPVVPQHSHSARGRENPSTSEYSLRVYFSPELCKPHHSPHFFGSQWWS